MLFLACAAILAPAARACGCARAPRLFPPHLLLSLPAPRAPPVDPAALIEPGNFVWNASGLCLHRSVAEMEDCGASGYSQTAPPV